MINIHCLVKALIILITSQKSMIIFLTIRNTKQSNVRSLPHTDHSRSSNTYKKMIRLVGDSSDISVFSVHESVFIFPSKHHLACTGKNLLCGSRFNQLTDYRNNPYLISFSVSKLFQVVDELLSSNNYICESQWIVSN